MYNSLRELQGKISKGELKAPATAFPEKGSDAEKAAWRQSNGQPATKDEYVKGVTLPQGVVLGEADKPLVDAFAQSMFDQGATQSEMNRAVNWFFQTQDAQAKARTEADGSFRTESEVSLRTEWGPEYGKNLNAFGAFKAQLPQDVQALLFTARTADGQVLGNHPAFIKIGAALGREINPAAAVVLQDGGGNGKSVADRIKEIDGTMYKDGKPNPDYFKNEAVQKEYRDLVDAQAKIAARGKAA